MNWLALAFIVYVLAGFIGTVWVFWTMDRTEEE